MRETHDGNVLVWNTPFVELAKQLVQALKCEIQARLILRKGFHELIRVPGVVRGVYCDTGHPRNVQSICDDLHVA